MDALGPRFFMLTFEVFCDHLTRQKSKLKQLDTITGSKTQTLVAQTSTGKHKQKLEPKTDSTGSESSSKPTPKLDARKRSQKGKSSKSSELSSNIKKYTGDPCNFCGKEGHPISRCWKHLEALEEDMQHSSIASLKPPPPPIGKGHALSTQELSSTTSWIIDYGSSHHMTHSPDLVTSLAQSVTTQIIVGDSSQLSVTGSRTISLEGGSLQDVLLVPSISLNLLSIFQICHSGSGKTVEFSPHDVVI